MIDIEQISLTSTDKKNLSKRLNKLVNVYWNDELNKKHKKMNLVFLSSFSNKFFGFADYEKNIRPLIQSILIEKITSVKYVPSKDKYIDSEILYKK